MTFKEKLSLPVDHIPTDRETLPLSPSQVQMMGEKIRIDGSPVLSGVKDKAEYLTNRIGKAALAFPTYAYDVEDQC